MICLDIIQEIRAAHKLMEQTLESKLNTFKDNKNEIIVSSFYEDIYYCTKFN
jgi:phosphosulfolactate phosphohydrolase-like enzyme